MSNIVKRSLTGTLLVAILVSSLLFHPIAFLIVFLLIEVLAMREFFVLSHFCRAQPQKYYGSIVGSYFFIAGYLWFQFDGGYFFSFLVVPLMVFIFVFELYRNLKRPIVNIASTFLGLVYIALPFTLMNGIVFFDGSFNGKRLLAVFILMWIYDSFAYLFGVWLGKHRLFERISPKKSWEGFIGGTVSAVLAAVLLSKVMGVYALNSYIIIALIVVVFGTLGDLVESMIKRSIGIKDSGNILPGHGGILDRFDSILLAIPVIFTYLYFFVN